MTPIRLSGYVEIANKAQRNGHGKLPPERTKCPHAIKAIFVEGGHCGRIVDVCADPACETHHAESRTARESRDRMRAENHKQEERRKQELAIRCRVLQAILDKVTAKANFKLITREYVNRLPHETGRF